ncbi:exported hypothetical protein [Desulfarculales bacterium]
MVKPPFASRLCLLAVALLAAGGCAYTTVTAKERAHAPMPPVKAGLSARSCRRLWTGAHGASAVRTPPSPTSVCSYPISPSTFAGVWWKANSSPPCPRRRTPGPEVSGPVCK